MLVAMLVLRGSIYRLCPDVFGRDSVYHSRAIVLNFALHHRCRRATGFQVQKQSARLFQSLCNKLHKFHHHQVDYYSEKGDTGHLLSLILSQRLNSRG